MQIGFYIAVIIFLIAVLIFGNSSYWYDYDEPISCLSSTTLQTPKSTPEEQATSYDPSGSSDEILGDYHIEADLVPNNLSQFDSNDGGGTTTINGCTYWVQDSGMCKVSMIKWFRFHRWIVDICTVSYSNKRVFFHRLHKILSLSCFYN